jgi:hypothetical protein
MNLQCRWAKKGPQQFWWNFHSYLEQNKFKMDKQRKIDIFTYWIYWISVADLNFLEYSGLSGFYLYEMFSLEFLLNKFSEILYEEANLNSCFKFKDECFVEKSTNSNKIGDIYNDMMIQPDLLTRAICSQNLNNLKSLVKFGYELNKSIIFPDCSKLKKNLLIIQKKINLVENEKISDKLKDKKLEDLFENLKTAKDALYETLNLNSPQIDDLDPLCSFEEIQK